MGKYRKGVFIVTYRIENGSIKYLVLKRKKHWKGWEFPKEGIKRFEFKKSAVKRGLFEETGQRAVKINSFRLKGKYPYTTKLKDRPGMVGQTYKLYSAEIKNKTIKIDKREHSDYKWMDFNSAWKTLTWPNQKVCLNYVNNYLNKK